MQSKENETKLDRERFGIRLCQQILAVLGPEYQTELSNVKKNNGVLKEVLYVRKENSECIPCFYMEELYNSYCAGENEVGLAEYLSSIVLNECEKVSRQAQNFLKKEWVKERLFLRLVHYARNSENLDDAVFVRLWDLAAVFYVLTEDTAEGVKSFRLPKHIWDAMEFGTAEEYFSEIVENTRRLFPEYMMCIEQVASEDVISENQLTEINKDEEKLYPEKLYILTNRRRINGAAVILYPDFLKRLGEVFDGDFYVIPSSVHEVLLLKVTEEEEIAHLNDLVGEVNEQKVAPEEVLSDHVYCYRREKEVLVF